MNGDPHVRAAENPDKRIRKSINSIKYGVSGKDTPPDIKFLFRQRYTAQRTRVIPKRVTSRQSIHGCRTFVQSVRLRPQRVAPLWACDHKRTS